MLRTASYTNILLHFIKKTSSCLFLLMSEINYCYFVERLIKTFLLQHMDIVVRIMIHILMEMGDWKNTYYFIICAIVILRYYLKTF